MLDLLLPGLSGYLVCEKLRAEGVTTPILVLSAKSGDYDQIDLLDSGADDFLTKPVSIALMSARLRALIRRGATMSSNLIERGALRYDLAARSCMVGDVDVTLTNREDQLLRKLLLANGACVTRQELLDDVWGTESGTDASIVDIYLRKFRGKLDPSRSRTCVGWATGSPTDEPNPARSGAVGCQRPSRPHGARRDCVSVLAARQHRIRVHR